MVSVSEHWTSGPFGFPGRLDGAASSSSERRRLLSPRPLQSFSVSQSPFESSCRVIPGVLGSATAMNVCFLDFQFKSGTAGAFKATPVFLSPFCTLKPFIYLFSSDGVFGVFHLKDHDVFKLTV